MNQMRITATTWPDQSDGAGRSGGWWSTINGFFRRQPEFVLVGAVVGGALLAFAAQNARSTASRRNDQMHSATDNNMPPWHTPAARLGATEEQMDTLTTPSARALEAGTAGVTGSAYELDPTSITSG